MFDFFDEPVRDQVEIRFLRKKTPNKPNGIFIGSLFPAPIRLTEVGSGMQYVVGEFMFNVFRAIIIGNGTPGVLRKPCKGTGDGIAGFACGLGIHLRNFRKATHAFGGNVQRNGALTGDNGIAFPMPKLLTLQNMFRTVVNADSVGDVRTFVRMTMSFLLTLPMRTDQKRNKILHGSDGRIVEILVDCFIADAMFGIFQGKPCGDLFRRPSQFQFPLDIGTNERTFQARSLMSDALTFPCLFLSAMSMIKMIKRRCIAAEFS